MDIQTFSDFKTRYEFDEAKTVGTGGFAAVYKGLDKLTGRTVAIKKSLVNPDREKYSLREEVERGKSLRHPNLIEYLDVYRFTSDHGTFDYGVLEYVNGGSLTEFLKTEPSHFQIKSVLVGILEGLGFLHGKKIIHRDLKPGNILIHYEDGKYIPKIIDFGISKGLTTEESTVSNIVGSWQYMSPEQISPLPGVKISTNSDLWSFGVIVYEIFTGSAAFGSTKSGDSQERIRGRILDGKLPEDVSAIPQPFQAAVMQALVKDARQRVSKASELITLISGEVTGDQTISSQKTEISPVPPVPPPPPKPPQPSAPAAAPKARPPRAQEGSVKASSAEWWTPALVIMGIGIIIAFFLPLVKGLSMFSGFEIIKGVFGDTGQMKDYTLDDWLIIAGLIAVPVSGILLLLSGITKSPTYFVAGFAVVVAAAAVITYIYVKDVPGSSIGVVLKSMGVGYWIPIAAAILLIPMRIIKGTAQSRHRRPPAAAQAAPPVAAPHQPTRRRRKIPVGWIIGVVLLLGAGAVAIWFLTQKEKTYEELIVGNWEITQIFEDNRYLPQEEFEGLVIEFTKAGNSIGADGTRRSYELQDDYLIIEGEDELFIEYLDEDRLRLSDRFEGSEISLKRID